MVFEVPSDVALDRLKSRVSRFGFLRFDAHAIVGSVTLDSVVIQRARTRLLNAFGPVFVGQFYCARHQTRLCGVFRMKRPVQIFSSIWLIGVLAFPVFTFVVALWESVELSAALLASLVFFIATLVLLIVFLCLVRFGRWASSGD